MNIGSARVQPDQSLDLQMQALRKAGCGSTLKPGQDFVPYDRPIGVAIIGSTASVENKTLQRWRQNPMAEPKPTEFGELKVDINPLCAHPEIPDLPPDVLAKLHTAWEAIAKEIVAVRRDTGLKPETISSLFVVNAAQFHNSVVQQMTNPFGPGAAWLFDMAKRDALDLFGAAHHTAMIFVPYKRMKQP